jgi:hypothetical protein
MTANDVLNECVMDEKGNILWVEPYPFKCLSAPRERFVRMKTWFEVITSTLDSDGKTIRTIVHRGE